MIVTERNSQPSAPAGDEREALRPGLRDEDVLELAEHVEAPLEVPGLLGPALVEPRAQDPRRVDPLDRHDAVLEEH
jgi:hypothetical protein